MANHYFRRTALDLNYYSSFFLQSSRIFRPDAMESEMVFSSPSGFILGAGENNRIWSQGGAEGLDRVLWANTIIFRVQSVILGTHVYIDSFDGVPSVTLYPTPFKCRFRVLWVLRASPLRPSQMPPKAIWGRRRQKKCAQSPSLYKKFQPAVHKFHLAPPLKPSPQGR
jgi:hypothetical protein